MTEGGRVRVYSKALVEANRKRWAAVAGVVALNVIGERRSLGDVIERTPVLYEIDSAGRV